ncbi:FimV/HubP family polar landmark protein [Burkholderia sp. PU8-34]
MFRISLFPRQSRLARAVRSALAILALGTAASTWAFGASDAAATDAGSAAPLTVTAQPGQSLNDLAIAVTQSRDPGVIARAGRALFDANPQAFMKRDPSRLKVGATLTVPALDATGTAVAAAGAAAAPAPASGPVAPAAHAASAPHPASVVPAAPSASVTHAAQAGEAHASAATGASSAVGASAVHGASEAGAQSAASPAGASGPHVWSGAIQPAPSSASEAAMTSMQGGPAGANASTAAAPVARASQPRPSSLQQLLALKNRVLMELQKHGIGKPVAADRAAVDAGRAQAPAAPRPAANANGASDASPAASEAAVAGETPSAAQPEAAPARPAAPVAVPSATGANAQIDWRAVSAGGAAAVVLIAGFMWRKRRKARRGDVAAKGEATEAVSGVAGTDDVTPSTVRELPVQPEMPLSRDAEADVHLAAAIAVAAETADARDAQEAEHAAPADEPTRADRATHDATGSADAVGGQSADASATPSEQSAPFAPPVLSAQSEQSEQSTPPGLSAPQAADSQQAILLNAITALNSLDMPLPPRTADVTSPKTDDVSAPHDLSVGAAIATNGQVAPRPPIGAAHPDPEHSADHEDDLEWDADIPPAGHEGASQAAAPTLPPLGGAQFGALKLDFDLDLPAAPGAALPALTPDELARIARNKLDLAHEYVELGDLSGARTLLQEVVDANDAATHRDAHALLAKLADEA